MATVREPRYAIRGVYTNGAKTTLRFQNEEDRDREWRLLNRDPSVRTTKRKG